MVNTKSVRFILRAKTDDGTPLGGEPVWDAENQVLKIGDGENAFDDLPSFVDSIKGVSGSVTIIVTQWSTFNTVTKTFTELGDYDCIEFYPATTRDRDNANNADIFVSATGNVVTFIAETRPTTDITFNYFITRGKA